MNTREETVKKSSMNAKDNFDYQKLTYPTHGFLNSTFVEKTEEVVFTYEVEGKYPLSDIQKETTEKKFRFLINFAALYSSVEDYCVELTEENVYYDENYMPFIMRRDIYAPGKHPEKERFMEDYKCFAGGLLSKKYTIGQLKKSGLAILNKDSRFQKICASREINELADELRSMKKSAEVKQEKEKRTVSKSAYAVWRTVAIAAVIGTLSCGAYTLYASRQVIPAQKAQIAANQNFIKKDYIAAVDSMNQYDTADMDAETKYILAYSYAVSESFKKEEIETITARLSPNSNEKELEYWIYLGRLNVKKAQEIALSLSDDKLLIYAYMKEADLLESDTAVSGENKKARLDTLEKEIQSLGDKYQQAEESTETGAEGQ